MKKSEKGGAFPLGLLAGIGGPILGEIAKPVFRKIFGSGLKKRRKGLRKRKRISYY